MKKLNIGILYFYIHFVTEVVCFYFLGSIVSNDLIFWVIPLLYDALAFVPQIIFGYINDKFPKLNLSILGIILLIISLLLKMANVYIIIPVIILSLGNAFIHVRGAELTLKNSNGKLSLASIFVSGGSFGVIIGKILSKYNITWWIIALIVSSLPAIIGAEKLSNPENNCNEFNYTKTKDRELIIFLAVFVVVVRGFIGYGIPTSWNKTIVEAIIFFFTMGIGKALGGILADKIGIKKVITLSTIVSIPFLCFGDKIMLISLIGVALFSMTMALTLGILVSVLKDKPGVAFGFTTIGLFLGSFPIFYVKLSYTINVILIIVSSLLCYAILNYVTKDNRKE